jgi:ribosomal protein S18 acetylase RimI-like enzyme
MLRAAGPQDGALLAAILVRTWRERYPGLVSPDVLAGLDEQGFADWFARVLSPPTRHHATVARVDGADAGFIHTGPDEEDPARGHVYSFYVAPPFSGRGVGRALLAHAVGELVADGYRAITLWVFKDNAPAVRLYTRAGFRADGAERVEDAFGVLEQRLRLECR